MNIKPLNEQRWLVMIAVVGVLLNYYFPLALFPLTDLDEGAYAGVTREEYDEIVAIFAVIITSMAIGTAFIYKAAIPDPFLTLFITIAIFDIYRFYQWTENPNGKAKPNYLIIRVFVFMGLGVLAKGPIAIVLPTAVAGIFFILQGKLPSLMKAIFNPLGWLLLLLIVLPWHFYQYYNYGEMFINDYFLKHNVGRFSTSLDGHAGNLLYYILSIFLLVFSLWLLLSYLII